VSISSILSWMIDFMFSFAHRSMVTTFGLLETFSKNLTRLVQFRPEFIFFYVGWGLNSLSIVLNLCGSEKNERNGIVALIFCEPSWCLKVKRMTILVLKKIQAHDLWFSLNDLYFGTDATIFDAFVGFVASAGEVQTSHSGASGSDRPTCWPLALGPRGASRQCSHLRQISGS